MSWGRLAAFLALALFTSAACEDDEPALATHAGDSGAGGAPESGGANAGGRSAGGGAGNAGEAVTLAAAGTAGAAGAACEGDPALWASLTASPPSCVTADDCCVVVNSCLAEAQIVHADDFEAAQTAWPHCDADDCTDCIPPVVRVACDAGHCVGTVDTESLDDGVSHCGDDTASAGGSSGQSFSCNDL